MIPYNPIQAVLDDEAFEATLRRYSLMTPEEKRARLIKVDLAASRRVSADLQDGERFDILEYPNDVPIIPACGNVMPSQAAFHTRH